MALLAKWRWFVGLGLFSITLARGQEFFRLKDVRLGLRGTGKTVFQGDRVEEFSVEILGILENFGPKQPIILARLSGGPLAETGILQGMSGSPVYIQGKLLGAVALGFPFSKEPICGIQPIESMLAASASDNTVAAAIDSHRNLVDSHISLARFSGQFDSLLQLLSLFPFNPVNRNSPWGDITEISTPLSVNGLASRTLAAFSGSLRRLGFSTVNGLVGSALESSLPNAPNSPAISQLTTQSTTPAKAVNLQPGSMISVGLITGDWTMTADGTVTYIDGNRIYAFGHRLLGIGSAEIPLAFSDVIACIPSTNTSFKISTPRAWIGSILSDRATAIAGEIGHMAHTIPVQISVNSGSTGAHAYHLQLVNDRLLTPFLTQAALFSTLDATERTIGTGTLKLQGEVHFDENLPPLVIHDLFVSDSGLAQQASADAVVSLAFVLGGGFHNVHIKDMAFRLDELDSKKQLRLAQAWSSSHEIKAGDTVEITAVLQAENGTEVVKTIPYHVPSGAPPGALNLTLSDANTLNFPEFAGIAQTQFKSAASLIEAVNHYRNSESLYVRIWRQQPGFNVAGPMPGGELSDPPPSVALVLADPSSSVSGGATANTRGSDVAQLSIALNGYVVTGAKTIQIEIKD